MRTFRLSLLPILLVISAALICTGVLDIGYLYIKSYEMKWTDYSTNWHPRENDYFTAGEYVTNHLNYEDGVFGFLPDYHKLLKEDLRSVSDGRPDVDDIDPIELTIATGDYRVQLCLQEKKITFYDSTLFKKVVHLDIMGSYELYDEDMCELLYIKEGRTFRIRDSLVMRGYADPRLIHNKIDEIWLSQISDRAPELVDEFEIPYKRRLLEKDLMAWMLYSRITSGNMTESFYFLPLQAKQLFWEFRRAYNNGSPTYGWWKDPKYQQAVYGQKRS